MHDKLKVLLSLVSLGIFTILFLVACSQPQTQSSVSTVVEEVTEALFTDVEIDSAVLEVGELEQAISGTEDQEILGTEEEIELALYEEENGLTTQSVFNDAKGIVCYITNTPTAIWPWKIWAFDQVKNKHKLILVSRKQIQSVACKTNGDEYIFSRRETVSNSSDYELYKATISQHSVQRLTHNNVDDVDVSANDDMTLFVWGRLRAGIKTVFYRTNNKTFFLASQHAQYKPTVSWNGSYFALIRQVSANRYFVMRYHLSSKRYKRVTFSSKDNLTDPTLTNNGQKVSWQQGKKTVRIKDLSTGKIVIIKSTETIRHPYITWDGSWLTLVIGKAVYTINLNTGALKRGTKPSTNTEYYGTYWALPKVGLLEINVEGLLGTVYKATAEVRIYASGYNNKLIFEGPSSKTLCLPVGTYTIVPKHVEHHYIPQKKVVTIKNGTTTTLLLTYTLKPSNVLLGTDKDDPDNTFIQPVGETDKQHMEKTDVLFTKNAYTGDLLFGILGRDTLVGGSWDDVMVGGPEDFTPPNSDTMRGKAGDDINIWAPGDGSDAFVGDAGWDVQILGPFKSQSAPGAVPDLVNANGRKIPQVSMSQKPQFTCQIEAVPANQNLGYDFLVRFAVNSDVKVTVRLQDVEWVICPSANANSVTFANLSQTTSFSEKPLSDFADTLLGEILQP